MTRAPRPRVRYENVRDLRLRLGRSLAQQREHAVLQDREAGLLELVDHAHLDAVAGPREQEGRARQELRRKRRVRGPGSKLANLVRLTADEAERMGANMALVSRTRFRF